MSGAQRVAHVAPRDRHTLDVLQSTAEQGGGAVPWLPTRMPRRQSQSSIRCPHGLAWQKDRPGGPSHLGAHVSLTLYAVFRVLLPPTVWHHYAGSGELPDRKSTRLNSSHLGI